MVLCSIAAANGNGTMRLSGCGSLLLIAALKNRPEEMTYGPRFNRYEANKTASPKESIIRNLRRDKQMRVARDVKKSNESTGQSRKAAKGTPPFGQPNLAEWRFKHVTASYRLLSDRTDCCVTRIWWNSRFLRRSGKDSVRRVPCACNRIVLIRRTIRPRTNLTRLRIVRAIDAHARNGTCELVD